MNFRQWIETKEKYFKGNFLTIIYFKLLFLSSKCKDCLDGYYYPQYGIAPHRHNIMKTGSFVGSTELKDESEWPDNYNDVDDGQGVWYCPNIECKNNINKKRG
jgi:hypothetical protein